jgi:hypothetical protein
MSSTNVDVLLAPEYLGEAKSTGERIERLGHLASFLSTLAQQEDGDFLDDTASNLLSPVLMRSQDSKVRLLTACCLADCLRLYAPEAPFDDVSLRDIFSLFSDSLAGCAAPHSANFDKCFYLLERLALVKAFVLLPELDLPLAGKVVAALLSMNCPESCVDLIVEIVASIIEDATDEDTTALPPVLLTETLRPLTEAAKRLCPVGYQAAQAIVRRAGKRMQPTLVTLLNQAIAKPASGKRSSAAADEAIMAAYHEIIFEVHRVDPSLLVQVLPNLQAELEDDSRETRMVAVELLGRVFYQPGTADEYQPLYQAWLARQTDVEAKIRTSMCSFAAILAKAEGNLVVDAVGILAGRLTDRLPAVRKAAVTASLGILSHALNALQLADQGSADASEVLIQQACTLADLVTARTTDKDVEVRRAVYAGITVAFAEGQDLTVAVDTLERHADALVRSLAAVPALLVRALDRVDLEEQYDLVHLLHKHVTRGSEAVLGTMLAKDDDGVLRRWFTRAASTKIALGSVMDARRIASSGSAFAGNKAKGKAKGARGGKRGGAEPTEAEVAQAVRDVEERTARLAAAAGVPVASLAFLTRSAKWGPLDDALAQLSVWVCPEDATREFAQGKRAMGAATRDIAAGVAAVVHSATIGLVDQAMVGELVASFNASTSSASLLALAKSDARLLVHAAAQLVDALIDYGTLPTTGAQLKDTGAVTLDALRIVARMTPHLGYAEEEAAASLAHTITDWFGFVCGVGASSAAKDAAFIADLASSDLYPTAVSALAALAANTTLASSVWAPSASAALDALAAAPPATGGPAGAAEIYFTVSAILAEGGATGSSVDTLVVMDAEAQKLIDCLEEDAFEDLEAMGAAGAAIKYLGVRLHEAAVTAHAAKAGPVADATHVASVSSLSHAVNLTKLYGGGSSCHVFAAVLYAALVRLMPYEQVVRPLYAGGAAASLDVLQVTAEAVGSAPYGLSPHVLWSVTTALSDIIVSRKPVVHTKWLSLAVVLHMQLDVLLRASPATKDTAMDAAAEDCAFLTPLPEFANATALDAWVRTLGDSLDRAVRVAVAVRSALAQRLGTQLTGARLCAVAPHHCVPYAVSLLARVGEASAASWSSSIPRSAQVGLVRVLAAVAPTVAAAGRTAKLLSTCAVATDVRARGSDSLVPFIALFARQLITELGVGHGWGPVNDSEQEAALLPVDLFTVATGAHDAAHLVPMEASMELDDVTKDVVGRICGNGPGSPKRKRATPARRRATSATGDADSSASSVSVSTSELSESVPAKKRGKKTAAAASPVVVKEEVDDESDSEDFLDKAALKRASPGENAGNTRRTPARRASTARGA